MTIYSTDKRTEYKFNSLLQAVYFASNLTLLRIWNVRYGLKVITNESQPIDQ
jgi:hypothetical protein